MPLNSVGYLLGILTCDLTPLHSHCDSKPPTLNQNLCSVSTCSKALQSINSFCLEMHGLISGVRMAGILAHTNSGYRGWGLEVEIEV